MVALNFHGALLILQIGLLVLIITTHSILSSSSSAAAAAALQGCSDRCGDVEIPYPFGMSEKCSLNANFTINCSNSTPIYSENLRVTNISTDRHEMTIMWNDVAEDCYNESGGLLSRKERMLTIPSLSISSSKNKFVVFGCDSYAYLHSTHKENNFSMGCISFCVANDDVPDDGSCSGIGCCQVDIPIGLHYARISPESFDNHIDVIEFNPCTYAFVVERTQFNFSRNFLGHFSETEMPVVVDWGIDNKAKCGRDNTILKSSPDGLQYNCKCKEGYRGNAYLPAGCQTDIDECNSGVHNCTKDQICVNTPGSFTCKDRHRQSYSLIYKIVIGAAIGIIALFICVPWLYLVLKKRKLIQLKEKFFRQNGGLLLRQKLSGDRDQYNSNETAKIFTEEELLNATLKYDDTRIIGQGGFGTVYKGILPDNRIIAIKKSKLMDQNQIEQFINEVVVLSQINHRNVVKLLGCCLETQVPSLVYEFVPNGTLSDHIHDKEKSCKLVWEIRLRIAAEIAEVLSYLHSAASTPIIHRDVKPSNILVDNYTAKVSEIDMHLCMPHTHIDECNSGVHNCTKNQICDNSSGSFTCKDRHRQSYSLIYKIVIGAAIGVIVLFFCVPWVYLVLKKRKLIQLKEKFFRQNGGLLLRQKLSGDRDQYNSNETAKIFTEEELLNATLKYDDTRIIGQGGFGTVYKGILPDNRIIAIKKSKLMDQNQIEQFINEVVVLSQINHRNVVKLLGCCLETQVPSLVYEFVPNGTLSDHIHDKEKSCKLVWEIRLRIAAEIAEVLSYLHSAASTPIIHRDVKPSNILVDNYTAKVSDFGASRLVPQDQIELATMMQGTLGYLDPEYLLTNQLTEKSDVYSFGVVLVELLTGKKALCFERAEAERSLAMHFLSSMKKDELFEIVESGIVKEDLGNKKQVEEVARLARRCLNVNGEERPTMKEVAMELEGLRRMEKHPWANNEYLVKFEETESLLAHDQTSISYKDMGETSSANVASYDTVRDHFSIDFNGR